MTDHVNREDSVTLEIKSLESSIWDAMTDDNLFMSSPHEACIFRTPATLRSQNEKAYIPRAFSFGPFHHGNPNLKAMEKIKANYLRDLLPRVCLTTGLGEIIKSIKAVEKKARACYAEPISYSSDEFVKILVIDGCFLIELFRKFNCDELKEKNDPVIAMACVSSFLSHDLALLENQVPWIVLEQLFKVTFGRHDRKPLIQLVMEFFGHNFLSSLPPLTVHSSQDIKHILDLLRKWLVSSVGEDLKESTSTQKHIPSVIQKKKKEKHITSAIHLIEAGIKFRRSPSLSMVEIKFNGEESTNIPWELMPSATRLKEAGIKFRSGTSKSILDIKFVDGVLEIPSLLIHDTTETLFRNLISYEQCYPGCETRFTSYAVLLDNLINTTKDLEILCDKGIIRNWMDPEAATIFFNKLYNNTVVGEFCYANLCEQVHSHCRRQWPRWRAVLVHNYFNTPWSVLSTLAALVLLILTFLQTFYTIKK
ncbi:UPF0481 protein At3g47200-like [Alnus glutinosa]|uniref:UPF0481 protein At3g47200-like n=1 Tax=Alnus glutinosa TaxID=3517 RepID=UPI002D7800D6|nr:UPF0481 protein At3g47200-like [Alnus glutinosa]